MSDRAPAPADEQARRIWSQLQRTLPAAMQRLLQRAIELADAQRLPLYLVGGPVRDAYLQQPVTDLDLVIEGDAWPLAEAFAATTGGRLTTHAAFRTAVVEVAADDAICAIDFVTARREIYPAPAALPVVTPSHMADDLRRRDFTINSLALKLSGAAVALLDPFDGIGDITARLIRVLHDDSFRDDPTRILRAARFAARLDFAVAPQTETLLAAALAERMIARTSSQRILHELWLTLDEPQPERTLALLRRWDALDQLELVWSEQWPALFAAARAADWPEVTLRELYIGLLIWPMPTPARRAFAARYNLPTAVRKLLDELPAGGWPARLEPLAEPAISALELERLLHGLSTSALRALQLVAPPVAAVNIARYLAAIRPLPALLSGDDLRTQGVPPGPIYRQVLAELRQAQLAGSVTTSEAARRWLRERLA